MSRPKHKRRRTRKKITRAKSSIHREPYLVQKVTGRGGRVLFEARPEAERAVEENVADTVNAVLQGVIEQGTGQ